MRQIKDVGRVVWGAAVVAGFVALQAGRAQAQSHPGGMTGSYHKATEGQEVVKDKLFPKKGKLELNLPDIGFIMNQSYLQTILFHGSINYYASEVWGFSLDAAFAKNTDKPERTCIENFYNDWNEEVGDECGSPDNLAGEANMGPAYVPVRELKFLVAGNAVWTPMYGKQLLLLSATSYFDLYMVAGGGVAISDYYPTQTELKESGRPSRGTYTQGQQKPGAGGDEDAEYGVNGRPLPQQQTNIMADFGIGQKYHFMKKMSLKVELRNYTLLGTPSGFETYFAIWGGFGVRL